MITSSILKRGDLAQIRKQSTFVRHEDLLRNQEAWLVWLRDKFRLKPKPGFPNKVSGCRSRQAQTALLNLPHYTVIFCFSKNSFRRGNVYLCLVSGFRLLSAMSSCKLKPVCNSSHHVSAGSRFSGFQEEHEMVLDVCSLPPACNAAGSVWCMADRAASGKSVSVAGDT